VSCGGWSSLGNVATIQLGFDLQLEKHFQRQAMTVLIECFDPDRGRVNSDAASDRAIEKHRAAGSRTQIVIVDWMVYVAGADIQASELPGVFSVERVGTGTLVILKEDPIDLTNPDDLRLVESVEPVIRRYLPQEFPRATAASSKIVQ
jgi:Immunity protein 52